MPLRSSSPPVDKRRLPGALAFAGTVTSVIPTLGSRLAAGDTVRVWVPACGDGLAAYALTIELLAAANRSPATTHLRVFATEADPEMVDVAGRGLIDRPQARAFLRAGRRRWLAWTGDRWQVNAGVRGRIIFSQHDPLLDTPFGQMDLVYARDLSERVPQAFVGWVLSQCVRGLRPGGVLVVPTDPVDEQALGDLEPLEASSGVFRVRPTPGSRRSLRRRPAVQAHGGGALAALLERVTNHLAPAALVVDEDGRIRAQTGQSRTILLSAETPHVPTIGSRAVPLLRGALADALVRALRGEAPITKISVDGIEHVVTAVPLRPTALSAEPLWLLGLHEGTPTGTDAGACLLSEHLATTAQTLKNAMAELQHRNRALGGANDALQMTIDELERSNREFATMNTELMAVRQEHEHQIATLNELNLDIKNLFQVADLAILVLDAQSRLRRYTPAAGRIFTLTRSDLGRPLAVLLSDGADALRDAVEAVAATGRPRRLPLDLDGAAAPVAAVAQVHPYRGDDGGYQGAVISLTDVSDLKAAEDGLRQQNLALTRANEDLERFAYIASHDLKSPLRSVRTMLEFLRTDLGDALKGENRQHLDLVAQRVLHMERMIQDLLAYSRLGREAEEPRPTAIADVVQAQIDLLDVPAGFTVVVDPELPTPTFTRHHFPHAVRTLVANALPHHDRDEGRVVARSVADAQVPTFDVEDDGPGIAERYHERIFEIFQKAGGRPDAGGSGMGLALVKKAVQRNGGTITVMSREGERGACFRFTWPEAVPQAFHQSA